MRILLIATGPRGGNSGYKHRAMQMTRELTRQGHAVTLLWFYPVVTAMEKHDLHSSGAVRIIGVPTLPFFLNRGLSVIARAVCTAIVQTVIRLGGYDAVQAETPLSASLVGGASARVVLDVHGDGVAEMTLSKEPAWKIRLQHRLWKAAIRKAQAILTVSVKLRDVVARFPHSPTIAWAIAPCGVDVEMFGRLALARDAARRELGVEGRIVFCYLGGLQQWQCVSETFALIAHLRSLDSRVMLLLLTQDDAARYSEALAAIGESGKDVICRSAPHDEVARLLPAADVGVLLRARDDTNAVSSPTKLGEYLAAGVPVLTTRHAGDAPEVVESCGCGMVLSEPVPSPREIDAIICMTESVAASRQPWTRRSQAAARRHRSWEMSGHALRDVYAKLAAESAIATNAGFEPAGMGK